MWKDVFQGPLANFSGNLKDPQIITDCNLGTVVIQLVIASYIYTYIYIFKYNIDPLVIQHSNGKSSLLTGTSSINKWVSFAMLVITRG